MLVFFGTVFLSWLVFYLIPKKIAVRRFKKLMKHGKDVEKDAVELLEKKGYKIFSSQERKKYRLNIDGRSEDVIVIADFVAKKGAKSYIVEVKSGIYAPSIQNSSTRRQLLEYFYVYKPDGILLLDMENRSIHKVEFLSFEKNKRYIYFILGLLLGGVATYLLLKMK